MAYVYEAFTVELPWLSVDLSAPASLELLDLIVLDRKGLKEVHGSSSVLPAVADNPNPIFSLDRVWPINAESHCATAVVR